MGLKALWKLLSVKKRKKLLLCHIGESRDSVTCPLCYRCKWPTCSTPHSSIGSFPPPLSGSLRCPGLYLFWTKPTAYSLQGREVKSSQGPLALYTQSQVVNKKRCYGWRWPVLVHKMPAPTSSSTVTYDPQQAASLLFDSMHSSGK